MYSLISVILLSIYLYFKKGEKLIEWWAIYYEKNIIKFYSYYYIFFTLYKIKTAIKLYLNFFSILFIFIFTPKMEKSSSNDEPYIMKKILLNIILVIIHFLLYMKLKFYLIFT